MGDSLPALARAYTGASSGTSNPSERTQQPTATPSARFFGVAVRAGRGVPCLSVWSADNTDRRRNHPNTTHRGAVRDSAQQYTLFLFISLHITSYLIISYRPSRIRSHTTAYERIRTHRLSAGQKRQFPPPRSAVCTHRSAPD